MPRTAEATVKAQLCSSQKGPREALGRWPRGKAHQGEKTSWYHCTNCPAQAPPVWVGSLGSARTLAPCPGAEGPVPKVPEVDTFPGESEGLRSSYQGFYFIMTFIQDSLCTRLSLPFLTWTCSLQRKEIRSRFLLAWEMFTRMTPAFQLLKPLSQLGALHTLKGNREIVPSESSWFKRSERKLNLVTFSIDVHLYLYPCLL